MSRRGDDRAGEAFQEKEVPGKAQEQRRLWALRGQWEAGDQQHRGCECLRRGLGRWKLRVHTSHEGPQSGTIPRSTKQCGLRELEHHQDTEWASPMVPWVKNPLAMKETQEMRVRFLGWEDLLEESMATHFSILAWRLPRIEKPSGWGRKELDHAPHTQDTE